MTTPALICSVLWTLCYDVAHIGNLGNPANSGTPIASLIVSEFWRGTAMRIEHILCPIDFSEFNDVANDVASQIAEQNGATLTYLHVSQPDVKWGAYAYFDQERETRKLMEKLRNYKPSRPNIECRYAVRWGITDAWIKRFAEQQRVGLIVIGTHGRTGLRRLVMGSVAEAVVRKAKCPVLTVKPHTRAAIAPHNL